MKYPSLKSTREYVRAAFDAIPGGMKSDLSGMPMMDHFERVMKALGKTVPTMWKHAALMHDLLEDTEVTLAEVHDKYPEELVEVLFILTRRKDDGETYWQYVRRVCASGNVAAIRIKLADNYDNGFNEERLAALDPKTRKRLVEKYTTARELLDKALVKLMVTPDGR